MMAVAKIMEQAKRLRLMGRLFNVNYVFYCAI
jgi:hypothetical protein